MDWLGPSPDGEKPVPAPVDRGDLPPLATTKQEIKQQLGEGAGKLNVNQGTDAVGGVVDAAIDSMKNTWVKLDEMVPENHKHLKGATTKLRNIHDPVRTARCSIPRLFFFLVTLWGLVFLILELAAYESIANVGAGGFLFLIALFVAVYLGGDIFMFEAFKRIVDSLGWQIEILKASRTFYEQKLYALKDVADGLEEVRGQMSGDIDATTALLMDMERLGKLRTVTSVVNLFHQADYDDDNTISGEEAELLLPHLTMLWEIVPGYDQEAVYEHVRNNGMTIKQFYPIVDALVQENEELAFRALEALLHKDADEIAGNLVPDEVPEPDPEKVPGAQPVVLGQTSDGPDVESGAPPAPARAPEALHGMAPPASASGASGSVAKQRSFSEGPSEALKPLCQIPTGVPTFRLCSYLEVGGKIAIWGPLHLAALICSLVSIVIFSFCVVEGDILYILSSLGLVCLTMALTGTGKLIEVVRVLRKQLEVFTTENEKLRDLNEGLAIQVAKLQKLKDGWVQLQSLCEGNVEKAKDLLRKSNMKSKMEAVGLVNRLFRMYDAGKNFKLTPALKEELFIDMEQLFHHLPGFDIEKIKEIVGPGEMEHKKIRDIVDVIVTFDATATPASATAPTTANGTKTPATTA